MSQFFDLEHLDKPVLVVNPSNDETYNFATMLHYLGEDESPEVLSDSIDDAYKTFTYIMNHQGDKRFDQIADHQLKINLMNAFDTLLIVSDLFKSLRKLEGN